ncbi:MAG: ABC transporter permease, partial [Marivivens sp.]|nr:ABC transporter permease [Marivivens sp.]
MAGGASTGGSSQSETFAPARYWLLLPSWVTLTILVLAPVSMMM